MQARIVHDMAEPLICGLDTACLVLTMKGSKRHLRIQPLLWRVAAWYTPLHHAVAGGPWLVALFDG